jgi:hypothetical protein
MRVGSGYLLAGETERLLRLKVIALSMKLVFI